MAACRFGLLARPYRDPKTGGMRRCRKKSKGRRGKARARKRSCKLWGVVSTKRGPRPACAAFSRKKGAGPNPKKPWVLGQFMPAAEYKALRKLKLASRKARRAPGAGRSSTHSFWRPTGERASHSQFVERDVPGRMYYQGSPRG